MKKLLFISMIALMCACQKTPAPTGAFNLTEELKVEFYGGTYTYVLETNSPWAVDASRSTLAVEPSKGEAGKTELTVKVPANITDAAIEESLVIVVTNVDGVTCDVELKVSVPAPSLSYGGETYGVKYFKDTKGGGLYWMTENLRYLPEGVVASSNPAEGSVFYPYHVVDGTPQALTDAESVKKLGYLYAPAFATGVGELTADNVASFEGTKGICPEGWYIPTREDYYQLCGASNKINNEEAAPGNLEGAVLWDTEAGYGSIAKSYEVGFNFTFSGYVNNGAYLKTVANETTTDVPEYVGKNAMSYLLSSTGHMGNKAQFTGMMSTFTRNYLKGRLSVAYINANTGVGVRCVKAVE